MNTFYEILYIIFIKHRINQNVQVEMVCISEYFFVNLYMASYIVPVTLFSVVKLNLSWTKPCNNTTKIINSIYENNLLHSFLVDTNAVINTILFRQTIT